MDNQLQSISKIFTEKLFRIPDYQRGYAWIEKQLKDFWSDIVQLEDGKNHYVGVLTLEKVPKEIYKQWEDDNWIINSKNFEPYYVVDGQQRLTTTIILLQALTESVNEKDKLNYSSIPEIKKRYIFDSKDGGISRSYIFGYEKDNPSYEFLKMKVFNENSTSGYGKEITIYTHNLEFAKDYFLSKLKALPLKEKELIFKKVTQNLLFNIYAITTDIDVFIAFETMNNRGKPLSNLELLKNRLIYLSTKFKAAQPEKKQLRKIINDGWKGVYHYLGKNKDKPLNDDNFLNNHCTIYFGHEIFSPEAMDEARIRRPHFYLREGYEDFLLDNKFTYKNILDKGKLSIKAIKDYVESLQVSVEIWFNINNPPLCKDFSDDEKLLLDKLYRIGLMHFSSLILAFYLQKPKKEIRINFLHKLERFTFLSILTSYRYNLPYIDFSMAAIKINKGELKVTEFIVKLEEKTKEIIDKPELIDRLSEKFRSEGFYQWGGIRYFLYEYETFLKNKSKTKKNKIDWAEYIQDKEDFISVEHIYPQTAKEDCWKIPYNDFGAKERRILNNSLGNLLPLSKPKNSSLQNKCFSEKVDNKENPVGYRYGSYSENEISGLREWTPREILDRGIRLLNFMEKQWSLDFKSDEKRIEILNLQFLNMKASKVTLQKAGKKKVMKTNRHN
ncbi:MAG TPA: DUF262 domain-containing HNH endonuclease family protein [Cytophagaceae bacterium]|jgi:hypothetical protein